MRCNSNFDDRATTLDLLIIHETTIKQTKYFTTAECAVVGFAELLAPENVIFMNGD